METLTFELRLPDGPRSPIVVAAGGADGDRDDLIEEPHEVAAFTTADNRLWTRTQEVAADTSGMLFAVTFTVGAGVRWELVIKNAAGQIRFHAANTTVFPFETVSYFL